MGAAYLFAGAVLQVLFGGLTVSFALAKDGSWAELALNVAACACAVGAAACFVTAGSLP